MSRIKEYEIGTAVKITTVLSLPNPTSVSITIKDSSNQTMANAQAMTPDTTEVYSYIYQSNTTDNDGEYLVIIDAVFGGYTSRAVTKFTLVDNDL